MSRRAYFLLALLNFGLALLNVYFGSPHVACFSAAVGGLALGVAMERDF